MSLKKNTSIVIRTENALYESFIAIPMNSFGNCYWIKSQEISS